MIPKIIHYCWFGKKELPKEVKRCIESWKKHLPDYKIIEWNEENFDVNKVNWTREAYQHKKYAFVSDYVRLEVLYNYGGIYFDTDIEVVKNIDKFLNCSTLLGFEGEDNAIATGMIGTSKGVEWIKDILDIYKGKNFVKDDGSLDCGVNVDLITDIITKNFNIKLNNKSQKLPEGINIYSREFFSPKEFGTGRINLTNNTYIIHHFNASWHSKEEKLYWKIKRLLTRLIGEKLSDNILGYYRYYKENGIKVVIKKLFYKLHN